MVLNITESRVSQIHSQAVLRLRSKLRTKKAFLRIDLNCSADKSLWRNTIATQCKDRGGDMLEITIPMWILLSVAGLPTMILLMLSVRLMRMKRYKKRAKGPTTDVRCVSGAQ